MGQFVFLFKSFWFPGMAFLILFQKNNNDLKMIFSTPYRGAFKILLGVAKFAYFSTSLTSFQDFSFIFHENFQLT